ncbi:hypothetical protein MBLNU230_g5749t1 [Neophaeotheca triangularis]
MAIAKRPRTLDGFFGPPPTKKTKASTFSPGDNEAISEETKDEAPAQEKAPSQELSTHPTYPFAIPHLPHEITDILNFAPASEARAINNQPDLDLLYYEPYIPKEIATDLFHYLRRELFFYRVTYPIKRGPVETTINTPRYTTVFGIDATAKFPTDPTSTTPLDATTSKPLPPSAYKCRPRPLPQCLERLKALTEAATSSTFNFALVNYYADGKDSISYHSDDERFLGPDPSIASFSLGARRDFLLKHKPTEAKHESETKPLKLPLGSGDMVLMRGKTQGSWLHSIPKRTGKADEAGRGRINVTFRRALVKGGTENYYRYNVGEGGVWKWDERGREMRPWGEGK